MDWQDDGIILSARRHGETSAIVTVLTREHGAHAGLVKGGFSKRHRATVEPGNRVHAKWRARLAEHLGTYTLEATHSHGAALMDDPMRLSAMTAALSVAEAALPEREAHPATLEALEAFLEALEHAEIGPDPTAWGRLYVLWEVGVLSELGFRLDLSHCVATGMTEDLVWVSPKSGRAVSREAGEPYAAQMLPLPAFLRPNTQGGGEIEGTAEEVLQGLKLTGFFLDKSLFAPHERTVPQARARLVERFAHMA